MPTDAIEVGRISGAWGLQGWFRIQPHAADPQALLSSRRWHLLPADSGSGLRPVPIGVANALPALLRIHAVKEHGDAIVARADEVEGRTAAEALRGARVFVGRASFPTAGPDEFYWVDLIGSNVVNREGVALGTVVGLIDTGPHCVLRLAAAESAGLVVEGDAAAAERLIPFVGAYVDAVSLEQRLIRVDWGLDY